LRALPVPVASDVLVGLEKPDDAAVVRLSDDNAIVVTLDFFTPVVDDARDFGRIAATNALSDVYAMGATPLVALNIAAFPSKTLPMSLLGEILLGGAEVALAAGIIIAGGHTIDDPEPKYGLSVVGTVHPDRIWTKGGARAGDALVLTKALGTGVLSTAIKRDVLSERDPEGRAMVASMCTLNRRGAEVAKSTRTTVHAATDVTGYGLAGHLLEMLRQSDGVSAEIDASAIVALPGARELAAKVDLHVGRDALRLDAPPRRGEVPRDGDLERAAVGEVDDRLHAPLPKVRTPTSVARRWSCSAPATISAALAVYSLTSTTIGKFGSVPGPCARASSCAAPLRPRVDTMTPPGETRPSR
jgi:selenium donor protein